MRRIGFLTAVFFLAACTASPDRTLREAARFWDGTDFAASAASPERTEARFADYVRLLEDERLRTDRTGPLLQELLVSAEADEASSRLFGELCEKYLYAPQSPARNDELYLYALERMIESPYLNDYEKLRPRYQLNMVRRNRPGETASDFTYTLSDGATSTLHAVEAPYTLLFFNDPDCGECKETIRELREEPSIGRLEREGRLRVLALYSNPEERTDLWRSHRNDYPSSWIVAYDDGAKIHYEGLYDLRSTPCLYLLDADRRVLVKGVSGVERIVAALRRAER